MIKGDGLLISLTNQKYFELDRTNPASRVVAYDQFYLIFGNSELRIKAWERCVFSNFNILNKHFDSKGYDVEILLN